MRHYQEGRFREQVRFLRRQFLQDGDLPFTSVLTESGIRQALETSGVVWKDRIYTPLVTLWVFLGQVISADHSCRAAVARLIAHRLSRGQKACSSRTGAYCQARQRLPEKFFSSVARWAGRTLDSKVQPQWLWNGRRVYMFDGTTVQMPDTPENQSAYPQLNNQKPGLGFPIARLCAVMSLACGAIVDLGICRYAGKGQGELSLLRRLWGNFRPGDVLLTDRLMCSWTEMVQLKERGIDSVTRLNKRKADFRRGKRLGKGDHVVKWPKPSCPRSIDWQTYKSLPDSLEVRETRVRVVQPGFRSQEIIVVTTLLDPDSVTRDDLASLYRSRWNQELDLRDIKVTLQMDVLRGQTPELVRKEIWTHILAYNLIRTVIAQAASQHGILPRTISFKGTLQTVEAFQPLIGFQSDRSATACQQLYCHLLDAVASHRVADRPDRFEPRVTKRRPKRGDWMLTPRWELKRQMAKRFSNN